MSSRCENAGINNDRNQNWQFYRSCPYIPTPLTEVPLPVEAMHMYKQNFLLEKDEKQSNLIFKHGVNKVKGNFKDAREKRLSKVVPWTRYSKVQLGRPPSVIALYIVLGIFRHPRQFSSSIETLIIYSDNHQYQQYHS